MDFIKDTPITHVGKLIGYLREINYSHEFGVTVLSMCFINKYFVNIIIIIIILLL